MPEQFNREFFEPHVVPDWSKIVKRSEIVRARTRGQIVTLPRNWPPPGWETDDIPVDDTREAVLQWFDFLSHPKGPLAYMVFVSAIKDASRFVRDAWRLFEHKHKVIHSDWNSSKLFPPVDARKELGKIRKEVCGPPSPSSSGPAADEGEGGTPPAGRSKGVPLDEAEIRVRDWLAANAKDNPAAITCAGPNSDHSFCQIKAVWF